VRVFENIDCMEGMKRYPDKYFELAIVDPPYNIKFSKYNRVQQYPNGETFISNQYHKSDWDYYKPDKNYFVELFRVSKNQIIWGGNYFELPVFKHFIFWYKHQPVKNFADGELAWSSFDMPAACFDYMCYGNINADPDGKIHPTQKPIALYKWLLTKYAKPNDKILDTHVGSASSLIACEDMGFDYVGFEIDKDYYDAATKRINQFRSQLKLAV